VLAFVKLAENISKCLDQATKNKLICALLHESQANEQMPPMHKLAFPRSLSFGAQRLYSAVRLNAIRFGFSDEQMRDYEYISDVGERWMTVKAAPNEAAGE
jgi:hypothetical protein